MIKENEINKFVNGRQLFLLTAVLFVIASFVAYFNGVSQLQVLEENRNSLVLDSLPITSLLLNVCGVIGASALFLFLNKAFSFIREVTYVFGTVFLLLLIANPYIITQLYEGTLLSAILVLVAGMLFSTYQDYYAQRKVFMSFVILSLCSLFCSSFYYLLPVFFIGFMQMRIMSFRSVLAVLFGIVTPLWILVGMGITQFDMIELPNFITPWSAVDVSYSGFEIAIIVTTAILIVVLMGINVLRIISYKMQVRAYNGFFLVLSLFTMIAMLLHYDKLLVYLPVLNMCLAVQVAHTFTINKFLRRYIPILLFAGVCIGLFVWRVMW